MLNIPILKHIGFIAGIALLSSCNLTKDVDIELPAYDPQPVVECYVEPGKTVRLLLAQSYSLFDPFVLDSFLQKILLQNAVVTVSFNGQTDTLRNQLTIETNPVKAFNYIGSIIVPATPGVEYQLNIELPNNGGNITGRTTMLPYVPIDSVVYEFSSDPNFDTLARVLTYITDDRNQTNYYRRLLNYASLDSLPDQDFVVNDRIAQTATVAFGTGYSVVEGDTVFNTIFHIPKDYYDYIESVQLAVNGNANPFAQPSPIKSNVSGTGNPLGIFTCLVYDRDTTIIKR